jgi:integrase
VLNEKVLEKLTAGPKRKQIMDPEVTGFGSRIESQSSGGRKSFFFCVKVNGEKYYKSLGEWPALSVKQARADAMEWAGKVAAWKRVGCPPDQSPFAKQARTTTPTFSELFESYITNHLKGKALHPETAEYALRLLLKNYLSSWLDTPIDKITPNDVLAAKNAGKGKFMQNSIVEFVRRLYNWSSGSKDGKINFWKVADNPAKDISFHPHGRKTARERFLQPDELVRFHAELKKEPHVDTRDILTLLLATGARKSNLYEMRWSDIHLELGTWHVPMSKSGEGYVVELLPAAMEVLERRERKGEFVFPANSESKHVEDIKKRWMEFRKRAGIPDVRLHDLRRSKGAYAAISGESLQKVAGMLGHRS